MKGMFVVKLTSRYGVVCWLSRPGAEGFRTLAVREQAELFRTTTDAHTAIAKMPRAFSDAGLIFSVESVE